MHGIWPSITGIHRPSRFGELVEEGGQDRFFTEKPRFAKDLVSGVFMVFDKEMLDYLTEDEDCDFEMGPLEELTRKGQVMVYKHEGNWDCIGP